MTRTELVHREAELKSEIDDLGDMYDDGLIDWDIYSEESEMIADELKSIRELNWETHNEYVARF